MESPVSEEEPMAENEATADAPFFEFAEGGKRPGREDDSDALKLRSTRRSRRLSRGGGVTPTVIALAFAVVLVAVVAASIGATAAGASSAKSTPTMSSPVIAAKSGTGRRLPTSPR
jgi:hypothetical protein